MYILKSFIGSATLFLVALQLSQKMDFNLMEYNSHPVRQSAQA